jgi:hypothetical protein
MNEELPPREVIAERAHKLWEQAGRPAGHDEEFWLRTKVELALPTDKTAVPPANAPAIAAKGAVETIRPPA